MKFKFSITQGFLAIMIIILVMVSAVGFLTYRQFVQVLDNAKDSGKPDPTVTLTKSLIFSITDAENKVKTFTLTEDTLFLSEYNSSREDVMDQLDALKKVRINSSKEQNQLDTLAGYVKSKLDIYDSLLVLQDEYRVQRAFEKVNRSIEGAVQKVPSKGAATEKKTKETEQEEERKFLFFKLKKKKKKNRSKKKDENEAPENLSGQEKMPTEFRVDYETVKSSLASIQSSETSREEQQLLEEFHLLQLDNLYNQRISEILSNLESEGLKRDKKRAELTQKIVRKANIQIIIFCVLISVLLVITSYTIIRYITRSNRYRKVLKRAKNEAESLARAKEHFVATVSHEIRTPMNIISGFTEQLSHSELSKQQRDQLETVIKASSHLLQLINEVLDFTKLQNYKLELETNNFDLRATVNEVSDLMKPLAEDKGIDLEFVVSKDAPNALVGDAIRLSQILINVTSNAVKFTHDGIVTLTVQPLQINEHSVILEFAIADTGIGMSPEKLERVFEAFEQAEASTSRTYGGTGLGLSITKKLIELHNGTVQVHSKEGVGTEIVIELPYQIGVNQDDKLPKNLSDNNTALTDCRILIADDEVFNRKLIMTILEKHNAIGTEAENGLEALELVKKQDFDVILMDARMPELDGIEATKKIRELENNAQIPIIALSAAVTEEDQKLFEDAGMNASLAKPFRESKLIETIANQISKGQHNSYTENQGAIDFDSLKSLSGDDKAFYLEMLETFVRGTKNGIQEIEQYLSNQEFKKVGDVAHRISAPCKHLDARKLYNSLKSLEKMCKLDQVDSEAVHELFTELEHLSHESIHEVEKELEQFKKT